MGMKISGNEYNCPNPQYLHTGQTSRKQNALTDEKSKAESGGFPETAAIYEKSGTYDFGTYSVNQARSASLPESALNSKMKTYLNALGFYDGEMSGSYTEEFKKALKCFQQAYWGSERCDVKNGIPDMLRSHIEDVGTVYYTNLSNSRLNDALRKLSFDNTNIGEGRQNFARIQTFLQKGMGCTKFQVAGIMGNIKQECSFNPKTENSTGAFGILQWRDNRRIFLEDFASKGGYSYKNMGVQLAYFRYEVSATWKTDCTGGYAQNSNYVDSWRKLKSDYQYDFYGVSDFFFEKIEECTDDSDKIRRNYSSIIYQAIC